MGEVRVYGAPSELAGKWIREVDHLAALRRAKAEGKLEGMEEAAILVEAMPMATPYNTALSLRWVVKERREADARAAQIEEG